jgi:hypothetical protein
VDFHRAAEALPLTGRELVHTTYYDHPFIREMVGLHVRHHSVNEPHGAKLRRIEGWYASWRNALAARLKADHEMRHIGRTMPYARWHWRD